MAVCLSSVSDPRAEMTVHEINQELRSQLAKSEQDFQDLMEKFLVSQATTYSLAKELQKYKCGEYQDLVESVLGEKLHLEEGKLAEQWALAEKLREYNIRIRDQEQQLTHLRHQVQEGREVSVLLHQHLSDLLTHDDPDDDQGPGFGEQLAEGCGLAKRLASVLSSENHPDLGDEEDHHRMSPSPPYPTRLSRDPPPMGELQLPTPSLDDYYGTYSVDVGRSDSYWTLTSTSVFCVDQVEVCSIPDAAKNHPDLGDEEDHHRMFSRLSRDLPPVGELQLQTPSFDEYYGTYSVDVGRSDSYWTQRSTSVFCVDQVDVCSVPGAAKNHPDLGDEEDHHRMSSRLSRDLPPMGELQLTTPFLDDYYGTYSVDVGRSDSCWTLTGTSVFCVDQVDVCSVPDAAKNHPDLGDEEDHHRMSSRLSRDLPPMGELQLPTPFLDDYYGTYSVDVGRSDSYWTLTGTSVFCVDQVDVCSVPDAAKNHPDLGDEEDHHRMSSRLSRDLPPMGELQLPTPSLDDYYGTYSVDVGRSDSYWTLTGTSVFCVDQVDVCSVPDAAKNQSDLGDEEDHHRTSPRSLSRHLLLRMKIEVPRDFLDEWYFTRSIGHDLAASYRPYTSSSLAFAGKEFFSALDAPELCLDACATGKNLKIMKRKPLFKWRVTCNFPGLQIRVLRYQELWN